MTGRPARVCTISTTSQSPAGKASALKAASLAAKIAALPLQG